MSAFIVGNEHIDILVNAIAQYGVAGQGAGRTVFRNLGQMLWDENVCSVDYRYREDNPRSRYVLHTTEGELDALAVLKAAHCYEYQSCEHPEWDDSQARTWITRLREAIYAEQPDYATPVPGHYSGHLVPAYQLHVEYQQWLWPFARLEDAVTRPTDAEAQYRASVSA
ncbi:hypothetical protein ACFWPH_33695 [Nocardia sp. NPDC058499]|uniref:hypothetical protein n=1 Tax=Nocardia sp. NPDC058499 TaxID=3346530 RepID=UPI00364BEA50